MLQFQSRGTLAGISGPWGRPNGVAGWAAIGVEGTVRWASEDAGLDTWLPSRLCHVLNCSKQWLHVRDGMARGLKFASWSSGSE